MNSAIKTNNPLNILERAIQVNQEKTTVIARNLASKNIDGYVREETFSCVDHVSGDQIIKIKQIAQDYQMSNLRMLNTKVHEDEVYNVFYEKISTFLGSNQNTFAHSLSKMLDAFSATPAKDCGVKQEIVEKTQGHLDDIHRFASFLQHLRRETDHQINDCIKELNTILKDVSAIQKDIRESEENLDLINQRRHKLSLLSEHIGFEIRHQNNPHLFSIYSTKDILLQQHDGCAQFFYSPAETVTPVTQFSDISLTLLNYENKNINERLIGDKGKIKSLVHLRDVVLPGVYDQLMRYGLNLSTIVNEIHNNGSSFNRTIMNGSNKTASGDLIASDTTLNGSGSVFIAQIDKKGVLQKGLQISLSSISSIQSLLDFINTSNFIEANIHNGHLQIKSKNPDFGIAIGRQGDQIMYGDKSYGFSSFFGLNNLIETNPQDQTQIKVRDDLRKDTSLLSIGKLVNLDSYNDINPILGVLDHSIATDICDIISHKQITFESSYFNPTVNQTLKEYSLSVIDLQRAKKQEAESRAQASLMMYQEASQKAYKISGVDIDTEKIKAYQISANQMALYHSLMLLKKMDEELFQIVR
jgi:flagellar hook-associated protein FlgK